MKDRLAYDYFYGGESEQFSFYRIPRQLIVGPEFKHVSTDAKLLYGLMLDRMGLSARNGWYDEENRVFIYYPLDEIKEALNCGNDKAVKVLAELGNVQSEEFIERNSSIWISGFRIKPFFQKGLQGVGRKSPVAIAVS